MKRIFLSSAAALLLAGSPAISATDEPEAPEQETEADDGTAARQALLAWTEAFRSGEYARQWELTHPRIRYWQHKNKWARKMRASVARTGKLVSYEITGSAPVTAEQLPCTEQGHCFRRHIEYHMFTIKSEYSGETPPQPEFVVMAKSDEGWRFGGGSFPNRPMGETSVILDRKDEARYRALR